MVQHSTKDKSKIVEWDVDMIYTGSVIIMIYVYRIRDYITIAIILQLHTRPFPHQSENVWQYKAHLILGEQRVLKDGHSKQVPKEHKSTHMYSIAKL